MGIFYCVCNSDSQSRMNNFWGLLASMNSIYLILFKRKEKTVHFQGRSKFLVVFCCLRVLLISIIRLPLVWKLVFAVPIFPSLICCYTASFQINCIWHVCMLMINLILSSPLHCFRNDFALFFWREKKNPLKQRQISCCF